MSEHFKTLDERLRAGEVPPGSTARRYTGEIQEAVQERRHGWAVERGVTCVVCPGCAFTFDAVHEDEGGGYSCPLCALTASAPASASAPLLDRKRIRQEVIEECAQRVKRIGLHARHESSYVEGWNDAVDQAAATLRALTGEVAAPKYRTQGRCNCGNDHDRALSCRREAAAPLDTPCASFYRGFACEEAGDHTEHSAFCEGYGVMRWSDATALSETYTQARAREDHMPGLGFNAPLDTLERGTGRWGMFKPWSTGSTPIACPDCGEPMTEGTNAGRLAWQCDGKHGLTIYGESYLNGYHRGLRDAMPPSAEPRP